MGTQEDLNKALKASGGAWTKEVNDLAKKRDAEKGQVYNTSTKTYSSTNNNSNSSGSSGNIFSNIASGAKDVISHLIDGGDKKTGEAPNKGIMSLSPTGLVGSLAEWANGLDPKADAPKTEIVDGKERVVYTKEGGMSYSYNFLGWPYEVEKKDGKWVDSLTLVDAATGKTGYQKMQQDMSSKGDNDGASEVQEYAEANASGEGTGEATTGSFAEQVLAYAEAAGLIKSQEDKDAIIADPNAWVTARGLNLSDITPALDANTEGTTIGDASTLDDLSAEAATAGDASTVGPVVGNEVNTYEAATNTITDDMNVNAATGQIDSDNLVDADSISIDVAAEAAGDGVMGNALDNFASQNISTIINTSTAEGKLLAQTLGEGNYTDEKATMLGQTKLISAEFKDSNGDPRIPSWAQSSLREVQKTIAFSGMTGTAATAAYANAIMEATLGIAEKEASFFQTITIKNLDNRQEAIVNKAKILAQFELGNLGARETAAVQNAKAFLDMDLTNLTNEQQAEVINKQAKTDALFRNTEAINAAKLFAATERNDAAQFYDELNASIQRHNSTEINTLKKFNAGLITDNAEFNADIKNDREKFIATMQYNIDVKNADWRQSVATVNNQNQFDAASTDIKNALDITQEAQNALWDDADNILDYIWKTADNDAQREYLLIAAQLQAQAGQQKSGNTFLQALTQLGGAYISTKPWAD